MTVLNRAMFASILFPPTILTPGREIEVRVMRPESPLPVAADGSQKWGRPRVDGREWFSTAEALAGWKAPENRHAWVAGALREGRDGTKAGVVASACLWADLDEGRDEALTRVLANLEERNLLPTLIVRSSPGKHPPVVAARRADGARRRRVEERGCGGCGPPHGLLGWRGDRRLLVVVRRSGGQRRSCLDPVGYMLPGEVIVERFVFVRCAWMKRYAGDGDDPSIGEGSFTGGTPRVIDSRVRDGAALRALALTHKVPGGVQ